LSQRLPEAWAAVQLRLQHSTLGVQILDRAQEFAPTGKTIVDWLTTALAIGGGIISGLAVVLVGGLYLAAQPGLYGGGLMRMIPEKARAQTQETFDAISASLRGWLKGQALGMVFVGIGTGVGLAIVGVPAAPAIGLVAGFAEFVPYLGTIIAGVPAIILGFSQGTDTGLWTIAVLVIVQQIQGNVVMPLLQNRMVDLPPAITIFGIIAAGILLGRVASDAADDRRAGAGPPPVPARGQGRGPRQRQGLSLKQSPTVSRWVRPAARRRTRRPPVAP
jgi:predicted PurR-regulated permease PerM